MTSRRGICPQGEQSESIPPSPPSFQMRACTKVRAFFVYILPYRGDENPRPGFDNRRQPVGQVTSRRGICPQGERSESIPPSPPPFQIRACTKVRAFFFYILPYRGDENPRPGLDNRRQPVGQMTSLRGICPQGERSESIPPLTAIIQHLYFILSLDSFFISERGCLSAKN